MKKITLVAIGSVLFLSACSSVPVVEKSPAIKNKLIGSWSCKTAYKDLNVGVVDLITLNANNTVFDESYIYDSSIQSAITDEPTKDVFSSPFLYLQVASGTWMLNGNNITYTLQPKYSKRLMYPKIFIDLQKTDDVLKEAESELFTIYSSKEAKDIELEFIGYTKNGFVLKQHFGKTSYTSYCTQKEKAEFKFNKFLELRKEIYEKKQ